MCVWSGGRKRTMAGARFAAPGREESWIHGGPAPALPVSGPGQRSLPPTLDWLHVERAIYIVNSFQFTRSARLFLALRSQRNAQARRNKVVRGESPNSRSLAISAAFGNRRSACPEDFGFTRRFLCILRVFASRTPSEQPIFLELTRQRRPVCKGTLRHYR